MYQEIVRRKEIKAIEVILLLALTVFEIGMIFSVVKWNPLLFSFFLFIGLIMLINIVWKKYGVAEITVDKECLTINNKFIFRGTSRKYLLNEITKIRALRNEKGENYTSSGQVKVFGASATPERWKEYEIIPTMIRFTYKGKEIKFGEGFRKFDAKKIVDIINENQINN